MRLRAHNSNAQTVSLGCGTAVEPQKAIRLQLPTGLTKNGTGRCSLDLQSGDTVPYWLFYELDRDQLLQPMKLSIGIGNQTQAIIPFTGTEEVLPPRTLTVARSVDFQGLIWTVNGATMRADIPNQQANPGQEFIIVSVRASNRTPRPVSMPGIPIHWLRIMAVSGGWRLRVENARASRTARARNRSWHPFALAPAGSASGLLLALIADH